MATTANSHNEVRSALRVLATTVQVLLDRIQLHAWPRGNQLPEIPGFAVKRDTFVRRQTSIETYRRVRVMMNRKTTTTLKIQYRPAPPWLPPTKISLVTERQNGLRRSELESIIPAFRRVRLLLVEFAVDFPSDSGIGRNFVLRHALFGRCEPRPRNQTATLYFGTRKSAIFVRAYRRTGGSFRIELEAHSRWLMHHKLSAVEDLARLPALLLPNYMSFFEVDWQRLRAHLLRKNVSSADRIVARCRKHADSLHSLLQYMRDAVGLKNCRRFLEPIPVNDQIQRVAVQWERTWHEERNRR